MTVTKAEDIESALRDEILRGQYRQGERLPSERDLAQRFDASRGAVREALKKLEQLGVAVIHPGGARVAPIENASLDVVGHLLDAQQVPSWQLVDEVMEVMTALIGISVRRTLATASDAEIEHAQALINTLLDATLDSDQRARHRLQLVGFFLDNCHNLVVKLIHRGLRMQFTGRISMQPLAPHAAPLINQHLHRLRAALTARHADQAVAAMNAMVEISRAQLVEALQQASQMTGNLGRP